MSVTIWLRMVVNQQMKVFFFARLEKNMQLRFVDVPLGKADLNKQFKRLNHLWGQYHHDLHDWMLRRVCTPPEHFTVFLRL